MPTPAADQTLPGRIVVCVHSVWPLNRRDRHLKQIEFREKNDSIGKNENSISLKVLFNGEEEPRPHLEISYIPLALRFLTFDTMK